MEQNTYSAFTGSNKLMIIKKNVKHILQKALKEQKMIKLLAKMIIYFLK